MADIKVLNAKYEESGKLSTSVSLDADVIKVSAVHQIVKASLASRRQGNACTKNKAKVSGGGIKPYKQKGTGRARQGSIRSPLMVGGGTVFGPSPRDYTQKTNKRMVLTALQSVLADKYQSGKLTVVEKFNSDGKTKSANKELSERGLLPALVVAVEKSSPMIRAVRNIRTAKSMSVEGFSVYEAVKYENLVIEKEALEKLFQRLV